MGVGGRSGPATRPCAEPTFHRVPWERGRGERGARCRVRTRAGVSSCQCGSSNDNVDLPVMLGGTRNDSSA